MSTYVSGISMAHFQVHFDSLIEGDVFRIHHGYWYEEYFVKLSRESYMCLNNKVRRFARPNRVSLAYHVDIEELKSQLV